MKLYRNKTILLFALILFLAPYFTSSLLAQLVDKDQAVKAGKFDTGKMWAFDFPPLDYFEETYGFRPSEKWLEDVRLSALRIPGCTASFVSKDGLIMTNYHCSDSPREKVQKENEDLGKDGFYAQSLEDERKVPKFYADQLVFMTDVTEEIQASIDDGNTETEKVKNKKDKISELKKKYEDETGLKIEMVSFFNGSKFSIYGYKRYTDIRLVFLPEESIGYFGGDYDNFTFPRYNLDCVFYRIYENDKPIECKNYFEWSKNGAQNDEAIFLVGNPGKTNRLLTVSQVNYLRETFYGKLAFIYDEEYKAFENYKSVFPDRAEEMEEFRFDISNGQKVLTNIVDGLNDPYIIARKKDFENNLQNKVKNDPILFQKYGKIWEALDRTSQELTKYEKKINVYKPGKSRIYPSYFNTAGKLIELAEQLKLPEDERKDSFKEENLSDYISGIFPAKYDELFEKIKLAVFINFAVINLETDHFIYKSIFNGKSGMETAEHLLKNSILTDKESVMDLISKGSEAILNSNDVFIKYLTATKEELAELEKLTKEAKDTEEVYENLFGQLLFEVYGTSIPPDANFTLRISDGTLKSFDYNGTIAPLKTTFWGLYDRYYSYGKEYPWDLPNKWANPPKDFNLSANFNFVSTHDAVGGSSGSPIINKNAEIVGLAFDGNFKSIIGDFIYIEEENRNVAVASEGILEALRNLYGYKKLADELYNGKLPE